MVTSRKHYPTFEGYELRMKLKNARIGFTMILPTVRLWLLRLIKNLDFNPFLVQQPKLYFVQFNLVCERRYLAATIQSTFMLGSLGGTLFFGALNDRL
jgi:hypothetical protein